MDARTPPRTLYVKTADECHLAYQVFGSGDRWLLAIPGVFSHLELRWEEPRLARSWRRMASFAKVLVYDKRGSGLSDRAAAVPTYAEQVDDVVAVMDAAACDQAFVTGNYDGGALALLLAATHPERVTGLVVYDTPAQVLATPDYPHGIPPDAWATLVDFIDAASFEDLAALISPGSAHDVRYVAWFSRYLRASVGPGGLRAILNRAAVENIDPFLGSIRAPTVVGYRESDPIVSEGASRHLASAIPNAELKRFHDAADTVADMSPVLNELEAMITGVRPTGEVDRAVVTVLFTDIVGSTELAATMGDRRWRELLDLHDATSSRIVEAHGGRVVDRTGDGMLATFPSPAAGLDAALDIGGALGDHGIEVRAGLHCGEVELRGEEYGGITLHIGARISALAGATEVLVSRTVRDMVVGSRFSFEPRGSQVLKGVPGEWEVYRATDT